MKNEVLDKVQRYVAQKFPEMGEVSPQISKAGPGNYATYVFTFRGKAARLAKGNLQRVVRVTTDEKGEILKISLSH